MCPSLAEPDSDGIPRSEVSNPEPQQLVTVGRKFGFFIAIVSVLVAPWIANAPQLRVVQAERDCVLSMEQQSVRPGP